MRNRTWLWLAAVAVIGVACESSAPPDDLSLGTMDPHKMGAMDPNRMGVYDNTKTISVAMPEPLDVGWAVSAGGLQDDVASAAVLDHAGDLLVAGTFNAAAEFGRYSLAAANGRRAAYVAKVDDLGRFRWAVALPVSAGRGGLAVDSAGNVYYAGSFTGTAKFGETVLTAAGAEDVVVVKLSSSGSIQQAVAAGGGIARAERIAVQNGLVTIAGSFSGSAKFGRDTLVARGAADAFVARLDSTGNFIWAVALGSDSRVPENAAGLTVDSAGASYITGHYAGNAQFGRLSLIADNEGGEAYVAKLDASGATLWAKTLATRSTPIENGREIVLDGAGHLYLTASIAIPGQATVPMVARLDDGGSVQWMKEVRGRGRTPAWISGLVADAEHVTIAGAFAGTKSIGGKILSSTGEMDILLARLDWTGAAEWANEIGGAGSDAGVGLAADRFGHLYVAGAFQGTLALGRNALTSTTREASDAFVWKMTPPRRN